jgi:hypothetical protein
VFARGGNGLCVCGGIVRQDVLGSLYFGSLRVPVGGPLLPGRGVLLSRASF